MKYTVILIEDNPGVQALTGLALDALGVDLHTLANPPSTSQLRKLEPDVLILSLDSEGARLELCKEIRRESGLKQIGLIVVAPAGDVKKLLPLAEKAGVNAILPQPFRSEQLQAVVSDVIDRIVAKQPRRSAIVTASDTLLTRLLLRACERAAYAPLECSSLEEVKFAARERQPAIIIVDTKVINHFEWWTESLGRLVLLHSPQSGTLPVFSSNSVSILTRPLTEQNLNEALGESVVSIPGSNFELDIREQGLLAARASAAVFEALLSDRGLKQGLWEDAGRVAERQVERVCKELEKLLTSKPSRALD